MMAERLVRRARAFGLSAVMAALLPFLFLFLGAIACSGPRAGLGSVDASVDGDAGSGGGGGGGGGLAGTGGFSGGTVPPFSIPPAPPSGALVPCDSLAGPEIVGLLPNGGAVVTQRIAQSEQRLVRLWTFSTNRVETLFVTSRESNFDQDGLMVADDGRYVVDIVGRSVGAGTGVRVFDLTTRQFLTAAPLPIAAEAVSADGRTLVDHDLRRFTIQGQADFDFAPLVAAAFPATTPWSAGRRALSRTGRSLAVAVRTATPGASAVVVVRQDGAGPPIVLDADGLAFDELFCLLSFSSDGRFVLLTDAAGLRVWDLETATVVSRAETNISGAAFTPDGARLVTTGPDGVIERDVDGALPFAWPIDPQLRFALGPGTVLGHRGAGLVALTRQQTIAEWRHPRRGWQGAVAVTATASFSIVDDADEAPAQFPDLGVALMLARFATNRAGLTATLRTGERQTEWDGQLAFSPDGARLAVVFPDSVRIVDSETLTLVTRLATEAGAIAWSPDGRHLAVTPNLHYRDPGRTAYRPSREVTLWDATAGTLAGRYATAPYPRGIAFDESGRTLHGWGSEVRVSPAQAGTITIFLPSGDVASFAIDLPSGVVSPVTGAAFVGSARDLVVEAQGLFRLSSGDRLATFADFVPRRAVFSADLSVVFAAGESGEAHLYAVAGGRRVAAGPPWVSQGDPLALSQDGRRLAVDESIYCLSGQ